MFAMHLGSNEVLRRRALNDLDYLQGALEALIAFAGCAECTLNALNALVECLEMDYQAALADLIWHERESNE
eukprot:scaffold76825_cov21-Tisochrysis_lutea.AAC.1